MPAQVDLRLQFNEQCFLVTNPGIASRAIGLPRVAESEVIGNAIRNFNRGPGFSSIPQTGTPGEEGYAGTSLASTDKHVFYLTNDVLPEHMSSNGIDTSTSYTFNKYFDEYAENSNFSEPPEVEFRIYKKYIASDQTHGEQAELIELPVNSDFQRLKYRNTNEAAMAAHYQTHIGDAQVKHLAFTYTGKDFAHSNVVECEMDIQCDSLQSLLRRVKARNSERYVSISDLIRIPAKNASEADIIAQTGNPYAALANNIKQIVDSQMPTEGAEEHLIEQMFGMNAANVPPEVRGALRDLILTSATVEGPLSETNTSPNALAFSDDKIKQALGQNSHAFERFYANQRRQQRFQQASFNCPVPPGENTHQKREPNPEHYQIRVEWGYVRTANGTPVIANPAARAALTQTVLLTLTDYTIDYTSEGAILLRLKYIGSVERVLSSPIVNLLSLSAQEQANVDRLREAAQVLQGLASSISANESNTALIEEQVQKASSLIRSIPGIVTTNQSDPKVWYRPWHMDHAHGSGTGGLMGTILRPLWSTSDQYNTAMDGQIARALRGDEDTASSFTEKANFLKSSIDHYLAVTRGRRYERFNELLAADGRVYKCEVPFDYLGYGNENAAALKNFAGSAWHTRHAEKGGEDGNALAQVVRENRSNAGKYRALNTAITTRSGRGENLTQLQLEMLKSVDIAAWDPAAAENPTIGNLSAEHVEQLRKAGRLGEGERRRSVGDIQGQIHQEGTGTGTSRYYGSGDREEATHIITNAGAELSDNGKRTVFFTTIGHIIEVAGKLAKLHQAHSNPVSGLYGSFLPRGPKVQFLLGPLNAQGTYQQTGATDLPTNRGNAFTNIGDIPVSMSLFQDFLKEKVIKRARETYPLGDFIKDLVSYFLRYSFSSDCNAFNSVRDSEIEVDFIESTYSPFSHYGNNDRIALLGGLSMPARWKMPLTPDMMKGLIRERSGTIATKFPQHFILIKAKNFSTSYLNPEKVLAGESPFDIAVITPPKRGDNVNKKVIDLKFRKSDAKFVREARLQGGSSIHSDMIRDVYDVEFTTLGVPRWRPGTTIYVDPTMPGGNLTTDPLVTRTMINNMLGMGGFYQIISARHIVVDTLEEKYHTTVVAKWNSFGGCDPLPISRNSLSAGYGNTQASQAAASVTSDAVRIRNRRARLQKLADAYVDVHAGHPTTPTPEPKPGDPSYRDPLE